MTRLHALALVLVALGCAVLTAPANADDPPKKLTAEERKKLEAEWKEANAAGLKAYQVGKLGEATKAFEKGLVVARRLYNKTEFPDGHPDLATSLSNLASLYQYQGRCADAEPLYKDALEMRKRLFKGNHPGVAASLNNLAELYQDQGRYADAEPLLKESLRMNDRLAIASTLTEGDALTFAATQPPARDYFLWVARTARSDPAAVYAEIWRSKGFVARATEHRALVARRRQPASRGPARQTPRRPPTPNRTAPRAESRRPRHSQGPRCRTGNAGPRHPDARRGVAPAVARRGPTRQAHRGDTR